MRWLAHIDQIGETHRYLRVNDPFGKPVTVSYATLFRTKKAAKAAAIEAGYPTAAILKKWW